MSADPVDMPTLLKAFKNKVPNIDTLLRFCTDNNCSDLYIKVDTQPFISRFGEIYQIPTYPMTSKVWADWAKEAISSENNSKYVRNKMLDFGYVIRTEEGERLRYRVSAGFSGRKNTGTFRMISRELPSFKSINFPKDIADLLKVVGEKRTKITMFCGPTGSGKTTTMAACINDFSQPDGPFRNSVIISLEDPIEYEYPSTPNVNILQKELGIDFREFSFGVKQALREHPSFINVGETRDRETINTLVEASRTGHAVYTSFHSSDVADTLARLHNYLSGDNEAIMYDLVANMNMILCQKLVPNGQEFKLLTQHMLFTDDIVMFLNKAIESGKNIPNLISELFKNKELLEYNIVSNWR